MKESKKCMWKSFCRWLLYKKMGWTLDVTEQHPDKLIFCLAPHTSNWDFLIGQLYSGAEGFKEMRLDGDERGQDEPGASADFPRGHGLGFTLKPIRTMSSFSLGAKL